MLVSVKEVHALLVQFQRAATASRDYCQKSSEPGYDSRRMSDVAHATGRLQALDVMQQKLSVLASSFKVLAPIDTTVFTQSFAVEVETALTQLKDPKNPDYFTHWGLVEAYQDVLGSLEAWESLQ